MKKYITLVATLLLTLTAFSQEVERQRFDATGLRFRSREKAWIDSVMHTLTLEQRIAQLMVVRVPLNMDDDKAAEFSATMNGYGVGGVCFFVGTAERQATMTRLFQSQARVPLLVCIDGEWGLGMRLKDMFSFPKNATFGLLPHEQDSLVYNMGVEIGRQCRKMGIHINFAPVVDINSNPKNPVIGTRSFGTDRERVSQLGIMYALGQQSQGVMAVAKHFPGHGDTDADSHFELPVINHTRAYIDTIDTYPFKKLIKAGVGGVMVAHLQVNALDPKRPSSLSPAIVDGLLRNEMGFNGLIITDGIDMKGVTNTYKNGDAELAALLAGNDIILLPPDVPQSIAKIKEAAENDKAVRALVDWHCRRVLQAKYHYVRPHIGEAITIPDSTDAVRCRAIVDDLNFSVDRRIDSIVQRGIDAHAMPGCQIVVMHNGRKVLDKAYGHTTYDNGSNAVDSQTIYDLASLTKTCATTLAVMNLYEHNRVSLDDRLSKYLPYLRGTNKEDFTVRQALSHQTRLKAFDTYWQQTNNRDTILAFIAASQLVDKPVYSDLNFILLADMVERIAGMSLDEYMATNFYRPMELGLTFRPLEYGVPASLIAPTEQDSLRGLIQGQVHDPNAFTMGGVSGHAGLFGSAGDVAALMQMLLDGGMYNGRRYLKKETIATFTSRHFEQQGNRRALGFDKQLFTPSKNGQACPEASQSSYGHTGFTGTMVWVDPEYNLVFVFLSNRVHPSAKENKLAKMNIRTDIQSIVYSLIK